jgi:hypothetical protein
MALLDFFGTTPDYLTGLLGDDLNRYRQDANQQALQAAALGLLQAGAPSATPGGGALAIARGLQMGQQAYKNALREGVGERLAGLQINEMLRKTQEAERMRTMFPQIFNVTQTPEQQTMFGQPAQVIRDEEGNLMPGAQVVPAQKQVNVDLNKLQALAAQSSNPLEALSTFAKLVPDLRKAGFVGAGQQQDNPFAIFTNDQTIPANIRAVANQYANSYRHGLIEPDKVDERVRQIGDALTRAATSKENADFRQQQLAQSLQIAQGSQAIALGNQQIQAQLAQLRQQAEANKPEQFSYSQKKEFDQVQEFKDEAKKASTNADIAKRAAPLLEQAYGGVVEAGIKGLAGAVGLSTQAKEANDQLARLSNQLAVNAPKFSGPTSDRDAARYDAAVGDLANPRKTIESKRQALKDIQDLSNKASRYANQAESYYFQNNKSLRGFKFNENPYEGM